VGKKKEAIDLIKSMHVRKVGINDWRELWMEESNKDH
jgi:hypothetical protein